MKIKLPKAEIIEDSPKMNYFVQMYGVFHTDSEFHKKIADVTYKVMKEIEPNALEDFLHYESGLGYEENLILVMKIVYNLLQEEIQEFYSSDISQDGFVYQVVLQDEFYVDDEDEV